MKHWSFVLILLALVLGVAGLLLAACGEGPKESGTATSGVTSASTQGSETATTTPESTVSTQGQGAGGKATVLRLAIPNPADDPVTVALQQGFVERFNERAAGKYVIEVHPAGSLVSMGESFQAVQTGAVEMADWAIGVFGSVDPVFNLAELPFAVNSIEADVVYTQKTRALYDKIATSKYNMKCLLVGTLQGLDIISVKPVKTLEDWKGLLCQTISPITANIVKQLGGSGVAIDFSEAYQAMQKKVIEASPEASSMILTFKLYEIAKYLTKVYLTPTSLGLWINLDVYNKMPADVRQILDQCGEEGQEAFNEAMVEAYRENFGKLAELGMEVYPLPAAERSRWAERVKPYTEEILASLEPAVADEVRAIISDLDRQFPYQE